MIEILGIVASVVVLASICFPTSTHRGEIFMRFINAAGSFIFVIYAILLIVNGGCGLSVLLLNIATVIIDLIYFKKAITNKKEEKKDDTGEFC